MRLLDYINPLGMSTMRCGGGSWDTGAYTSAKATRAATGVKDFAYTATASSVHANLNPKRIKDKPFGKLEARDSDEHPNSHPVLVAFDVTGSNYERAVDAQKRLPNLMDLLNKYVADPQVAVAANDDYFCDEANSIQVSDFESDNRVDEHIRNVWLTRHGGGNDGESYNLMLYVAARKVALDSVEKRGKKGYFFMYADEPIFSVQNSRGYDEIKPFVLAEEVKVVFGDTIERDIPIAEIIEEARRNFNIFVIWPEGGYAHARQQYVELFGAESVLTLQHPNLICELIASTVGLYEDKVTPDTAVTDLVAVGVSSHEAKSLVKHVSHASASSLATSGAGKAARL